MNRREFIIAGGTLSVAAVASAQSSPMPRRVAALLTVESATGRANLARFQERLQQLGWLSGTTVRVDAYWAGDDYARVRDYVTRLIETKPDVILSQGTISLRALIEHKVTTIPTVFVQVTDPAGEGFVRSLARPGGNITGFANFGSAIGRDRLRLLKVVVPELSRVMLVRDVAYPTPPGLLRNTEAEASSLGIELHAAGVRDADELESAITEFGRKSRGALVVLSDPFTGTQMGRIVRLADRNRLPAIYALASYVEAGGLLSYGVDLPAMWRAAAEYVDRILRGTKPDDLPVREPTEPEIVVNLKTAKTLGLTVPMALLSRATRIVQ